MLSAKLGMARMVVKLVALICFLFCSEFALGQVSDSEIRNMANEAGANRAMSKVPTPPKTQEIDFLSLLERGGVFMWPIGLVSLCVVTYFFDRLIGLRRGKLLPASLRKSLVQQIRAGELIDPRVTYRECLAAPSAAANIIRAAVVRTGRPQAELLSEVTDVTQREVDRAYSNVKWLNFSAGVAPLLGLLGTVWGLIQAFHDTTQRAVGENRAEFLAKGIYEALVTTLAGLMVAIPAAVASHYFEGRITKIFSDIQDLTSEFVRCLERFEGRTRYDVVGKEIVARDIPSAGLNSNAVGSVVPPPVSSSLAGNDSLKAKVTRTTKS